MNTAPAPGASPEDTAAAYRAAIVDARWEDAFACLEPEARPVLVAATYYGAAMLADSAGADQAGFAALLRRHGLGGHRGPAGDAAALAAMLADLHAWAEANLPEGRGLDLRSRMARTEYSEFRVDGDLAYAVATTNGRRSETRFRRIEGRWYLS